MPNAKLMAVEPAQTSSADSTRVGHALGVEHLASKPGCSVAEALPAR